MSAETGVGVVIPVRDRPEALLRALRSVHEQTWSPTQIVVVDDGSTEPVADLGVRSGDTTIVRLDISVGPSRARNAGVDLLDTEWVAFLDSDDEWNDDRLRFARQVQTRTGADCIVDSFTLDSQTGPGRPMRMSTALRVGPGAAGHLLSGRMGVVVTSCIFMRTRVVRELRFDSELEALEDLDLVARAAEAGFAVWRTDAAVVHKSVSDVRQYDHRRARAARTRLLDRDRTILQECLGADTRFRLQILRGSLERARQGGSVPARLALPLVRAGLGADRALASLALHRTEQRLELREPAATDRPSMVFVLPNLEVGGLQVATLRVLEELRLRHGWDVTVVSLRGESATQTSRIPVSGQGAYQDLSVTDLALPGRADRSLRNLFVGAARLRDVVDRTGPDVVLSATFECDAVARASRLRTRPDEAIRVSYLINTTYEPEVVRLVGRGRMRPSLVRMLDAVSGRILTDHHVAISSAVAASARRRMFVPRARITVIPRGAEVAPDPVSAPRDESTALRLVAGGRLVPQKGFCALIEGVCRAQQMDVDVTLSIFGDGPLRPDLEALAARASEGSISLHPPVDDFPDRLVAYDMFCFPSLWEGFGNALLEAMHRGMPVSVSDLPVLREVTGGEALRFVAPGSAQGWADAVCEVASLRSCFGASGRAMARRARNDYTVEREGRRLDVLLRGLIGGPSGPPGREETP